MIENRLSFIFKCDHPECKAFCKVNDLRQYDAIKEVERFGWDVLSPFSGGIVYCPKHNNCFRCNNDSHEKQSL